MSEWKIYALVDPRSPGSIRYIGKTERSLDARLSQHIKRCQIEKCPKARWISSLLAEGIEPSIFLIEDGSNDTWQDRERYWISLYRRISGGLLNLTEGGEGFVGTKHRPETIAKMITARTGKRASIETRAKLSALKKGSTLSDETRKRISMSLKGRDVIPPAVRQHISDQLRGRRLPQWHKDRLRETATGRTHSEETREKIRQATLRSMTPDRRKAIGDASRGRKASAETRALLSAAHKGKKRSADTQENCIRSI